MNGICKCCNQQKDLRLGICYTCAECESMIEEGLDMYDKEPVKIEGFSQSIAKLRYILERFKIVTHPNKINP